MAVATWKGVLIAQSDETIIVEGNYYFPPDAVKREYLRESNTHTICSWKGQASYFDIEVNGERNPDAAWYYPETKERAADIKNYIAFWRGVEISK
jgi:uncharacterized protein (DUF427 family)